MAEAGRARRPRGAGTPEGTRAVVVAVISTVVFFGVAAWLVSRSPNWPKVRRQFFNGDQFRKAWPDVLSGFWLDVRMFVYVMVVMPVLGLVVAVMRSLRGPVFVPLRVLAVVYIDILRGIPLILLVLLLGFGVPALELPGLPSDAMFWGVTALSLSYGAYTAEIFRSGMDAVPESQRASARAIGLTQWQSLRYAVIPQALRSVVPAFMNTVVSLQKDVALVSVLGVREAVREAQISTSRSFNYTPYLAATVLFLLFSIPLARTVDWYTRRERQRRTQAFV